MLREALRAPDFARLLEALRRPDADEPLAARRFELFLRVAMVSLPDFPWFLSSKPQTVRTVISLISDAAYMRCGKTSADVSSPRPRGLASIHAPSAASDTATIAGATIMGMG